MTSYFCMIFINFAKNNIYSVIKRGEITSYYKNDIIHIRDMKLRSNHILTLLMVVVLIAGITGCKKEGKSSNVPADFNSLTTDKQMEYLMENMTPDSVAIFISEAAMGQIYDAKMELNPALSYAFEHYNQEQQDSFIRAAEQYKKKLPLHEKVKYVKLEGFEDIDNYSYELGLSYTGIIRDENKSVEQVKDELEALKKECKYDPDFYKRFMTGFKYALEADRHRDLNDKIYLTFINYPDNL